MLNQIPVLTPWPLSRQFYLPGRQPGSAGLPAPNLANRPSLCSGFGVQECRRDGVPKCPFGKKYVGTAFLGIFSFFCSTTPPPPPKFRRLVGEGVWVSAFFGASLKFVHPAVSTGLQPTLEPFPSRPTSSCTETSCSSSSLLCAIVWLAGYAEACLKWHRVFFSDKFPHSDRCSTAGFVWKIDS